MLKIRVLGSGCANCKRLEQMTRHEADKLGMATDIDKVTDYAQIMTYGVMPTSGLVINEQVMAYGRIPSNQEVADWLNLFSKYTSSKFELIGA